MSNSIQISFMGAAGEVTGSKSLLIVNGKKILIDAGLFQGEKQGRNQNWDAPPFRVEELDAIILTHAHLDHSGYLPRLVKEGYNKKILVSPGTHDLLKIMLPDSAHIQMEDADFANASGYSRHKPAMPLYTIQDVEKTMRFIESRELHEWYRLTPEIEFCFTRAGHIVGSSVVQFKISHGGEKRTITFSGDIGHSRQLTIQGPDSLPETDVLVLESTYGNRLHSHEDPQKFLARILNEIHSTGGTLVVPSFAVGRAQEVIYLIRTLEDRKLIPPMPVLLDSPLSEEATQVYLDHPEDHPDSAKFAKKKDFYPKYFEVIKSPQQSMEAVLRNGPMVVITASGMLQGGRVLHHLKTRLPDPKNYVLFVGYQAEGTKGRFLQELKKKGGQFKIHHVPVQVNAKIETLEGLSAHGDQADLIEWVKSSEHLPKRIILNHGVLESSTALAERIQAELQIPTTVLPEPKVISI